MVSAIIMASGYSRRMKKNKLLLKYRGKTLIQRTLDEVLKSDFSQVILVAREKEILQLGDEVRITLIENKAADKGISESIKLGVISADPCEGYMFFTADQPFLEVKIINELIQSFNNNKSHIIVPQYEGRRGSPVIFPAKFKEELESLQGDTGGKQIINKHYEEVCFVDIHDEKALFDVDTPEDYEKILRWNEEEDES